MATKHSCPLACFLVKFNQFRQHLLYTYTVANSTSHMERTGIVTLGLRVKMNTLYINFSPIIHIQVLAHVMKKGTSTQITASQYQG
jgi:hypothetical protein